MKIHASFIFRMKFLICFLPALAIASLSRSEEQHAFDNRRLCEFVGLKDSFFIAIEMWGGPRYEYDGPKQHIGGKRKHRSDEPTKRYKNSMESQLRKAYMQFNKDKKDEKAPKLVMKDKLCIYLYTADMNSKGEGLAPIYKLLNSSLRESNGELNQDAYYFIYEYWTNLRTALSRCPRYYGAAYRGISTKRDIEFFTKKYGSVPVTELKKDDYIRVDQVMSFSTKKNVAMRFINQGASRFSDSKNVVLMDTITREKGKSKLYDISKYSMITNEAEVVAIAGEYLAPLADVGPLKKTLMGRLYYAAVNCFKSDKSVRSHLQMRSPSRDPELPEPSAKRQRRGKSYSRDSK